MNEQKFTIDLAGKPIEAGFSRIAEQADASCIVTYGQTVVLITVVMGKRDRTELDYFPLVVDYEEKYYAAGKIYGSRFIRRESRPSEAAVLTGRMIDRIIRPRFDHRARRDVQVIPTILSIDGENDPDVPALLGASLALTVSTIPFSGPIAAVRIAKVDGKFAVNPTYQEREKAELDLFFGGTASRINMIDGNAKEAPEADVVAASRIAHGEIKKLIGWQNEMREKLGQEKAGVVLMEPDAEMQKKVREFLADKLHAAVYERDKATQQTKISELKNTMIKHLKEKEAPVELLAAAEHLFEKEIDVLVHDKIVNENARPDGRKPNEIRPLEMQVGMLPRAHGSALFARGNTQALSVVTLGAPGDVLLQQGMEVTGEKRFMHHYNFPPYCVGEVGRLGAPGRREISHGALAEKSVGSLIPEKEEFPYTIRAVSEILSSNGSSSMASVCGTSLALMDAGVPIKKPAAGIAMGLMMLDNGRYTILTDIQGPEDHHGDMDCKIAGTNTGITAMQMDVKIDGITPEMLDEILEQAKTARLFILEEMSKVIPAPRPNLSPFAPRIITLQINPDKIREVIGPGGKVINAITAETGVTIDIEDTGLIFVTAENEAAAQKAIEWIKNITREVIAGEIFQGKVTKILEFGAIVEILPNQEGMVHISELAPYRVRAVEDIVKIGDVIPVKVKEVTPDGKIRLSLKEAKRERGENDIHREE